MAMQPASAGRPELLCERSGCAKILVAEDPIVSTFLRAVLQRHGHEVVTGEYPEARELVRRGDARNHVVITNRPDVFLPFAETLPVLYIAANPDPALALQFPICRVLRKPFRNGDLLEAVEDLARRVVS